MYRCTTTKAAFGTPESVLQPESRASPTEGNTTIGHFPACLRVQNITEKNATGTPVAQQEKKGAPHVLGCTPKWSIRGGVGIGLMTSLAAPSCHTLADQHHCVHSLRRRQSKTWPSNDACCAQRRQRAKNWTHTTQNAPLSVGRTPRSVPLTTVSPPQRRQRYKTCPNTDACHPQRRRSPKSRPSNDAYEPHT